ncbi:carbohydrate-binding protein [Ornithinimicrobium pekingense]|uniref:Carbohydrate-binding protein n=1 Tax=Ornithinimicrobium pekingense TaxID=384677 RepID=A0ABQ2FDG1_9MICO|nr:carbohydrate-binding protein [Ornithinimicrobium pekingense]
MDHSVSSVTPGSGLSRRTLFKALGVGALGVGSGGLAGCSGGLGDDTLRFLMNKPEVVGYFGELITAYNEQSGRPPVFFDSTPTSISAQFVRGVPPDLACYNYQYEASTYVNRDVLTDLRDTAPAQQIAPHVQELVSQFADEEHRFHVLPYSTAAAGVIYNVALFEDNGVEVPTTWSEVIQACQTFQDAGVVPIYGTYQEGWTMAQGIFDYCVGGMIDVAGFYARLREVGDEFEAGADYSFSVVMADAVARMTELAEFDNEDAAARGYSDGNLAFGQGQAAMYLQGPWALGEIEKVDPDLQVATFPLPMTDDPEDTKCRVNLDLGMWIPAQTPHREAAMDLLTYLFQPDIINTYNAENLYYSPLEDAPAQPDERVAGLQEYVDSGRFYQGPSTFIPPTIPLANYLQELLITGDPQAFLRKLDEDWRRLALRSA